MELIHRSHQLRGLLKRLIPVYLYHRKTKREKTLKDVQGGKSPPGLFRINHTNCIEFLLRNQGSKKKVE
jgi:hypothetical protein